MNHRGFSIRSKNPMGIVSYREGLDRALRGRTYDGPDRGIKIDCNTWLYFHEGSSREPESYLRLQLHATDLVHMYEDRIVFVCDGWNTMTTQQRLQEFTRFSVGSVQGKYREYFTNNDGYARLHLIGAPSFGLTWEPGVTCTWDGQWIRTPDKAGEYVNLDLPLAGARSRARKAVNKIRKELRAHLTMRIDRVPTDTPEVPEDLIDPARGRHPYDGRGRIVPMLLKRWHDLGDIPAEHKDYVVDTLLIGMIKSEPDCVNLVLKDSIKPEMFYQEEIEERTVHYTEVDELLNPRGPEWPEGS